MRHIHLCLSGTQTALVKMYPSLVLDEMKKRADHQGSKIPLENLSIHQREKDHFPTGPIESVIT